MPSPTSPEEHEKQMKMIPVLEDLGVASIVPRGKNVLILGLKVSYKRLAAPMSGDDPMDKPSRGLVLAVGPKARKVTTKDPDDGSEWVEMLRPGMVVYFAKFEGSEIVVGGRTFFLLDEEKVKAIDAAATDVSELVKNTY